MPISLIPLLLLFQSGIAPGQLLHMNFLISTGEKYLTGSCSLLEEYLCSKVNTILLFLKVINLSFYSHDKDQELASFPCKG